MNLEQPNFEVTPDEEKEGRILLKESEIAEMIENKSEKVANNIEQVNEQTEVYIGEWNVDVYKAIKEYPNVTNLYESFPNKEIFMQVLETDPSIDSYDAVKQAFEDKDMRISDHAGTILEKTDFSGENQNYKLVGFTVEQLGLMNGATTTEIYERAKELGLDLCSAEVGPQLRLQDASKTVIRVAMKQFVGYKPSHPRHDGNEFDNPNESIFTLEYDGGSTGKLMLAARYAEFNLTHNYAEKFIFSAQESDS